MNINIRDSVVNIIKKCSIAMLGTTDDKGQSHIKAMLIARLEEIKNIYFCSNVSSKRYNQIKNNEKCCLYFYNSNTFEGVCLYGKSEVHTEKDILSDFW